MCFYFPRFFGLLMLGLSLSRGVIACPSLVNM